MTRDEEDEENADDASAEGVELVSLDALDPKADPSELAEKRGSDPTADSPGDEGLLEQEEQYEGISSEQLPSRRDREP